MKPRDVSLALVITPLRGVSNGRAYAIFYLLGVGCLVPWNAFIMLDG